jgi:chorismate mutase/prephenate dehydratase
LNEAIDEANHSRKISVAFQGEYGAYSEQAVRAHFRNPTETQPYRTIKQVFETVERGIVQYGVVPAENSLEGSINQTYDCLLDTNLRICGEVEIRVAHCLLGLPGTNLNQLRVVYSHPQALAQCSAFLEELGAITEPTYDTAGSAKLVRDRRMRDAAAIASEDAGALYGLEIIKREIEDFPQNFTRFFVIGKNQPPRTGRDKTSIVFATHHVPGSLSAALAELAVRSINLTKIESRPIKRTPWEYHFFVDFEGHESDSTCSSALNALEKHATSLKILGSYPRKST